MSEIATADELDLVRELKTSHETLRAQIARVIVGQTDVVDEVLVAIFCRRHALLVGAPGLAKTLLVSTIARALDLSFKRIQFTPDLMPSDITGTEVLEEDPATGRRGRRFLVGPIFANLVLADEINRTPPKTQAALLEAMQERHVTVGENTYQLPDPFFVLATQNPIEQEGTYPLPEAQLDRFMFDIRVGYPKEDEEIAIIRQVTGAEPSAVEPVLGGGDVLRLQKIVRGGGGRPRGRIRRPHRPRLADAEPPHRTSCASWSRGGRAARRHRPRLRRQGLGRAAGPRACDHQDVGERMTIPVMRHRIIPPSTPRPPESPARTSSAGSWTTCSRSSMNV
ncbi:MAG: AAA family ATPase [Kiritimatiellia bacterium]